MSPSCRIQVTNIQTGAPRICTVTWCCFLVCSLLLSWQFLTCLFDFHWADTLLELSTATQRHFSWVVTANLNSMAVFIYGCLFSCPSLCSHQHESHPAFQWYFENHLQVFVMRLIHITLIIFVSWVSFVTSFFPDQLQICWTARSSCFLTFNQVLILYRTFPLTHWELARFF